MGASHVRARQLEQEDITSDVLLLTMEDKQKSEIWETFENAPHVYTVKEYVGETGDIPALYFFKDEPYTIERADDGAFVVEGPKIEKMLGYTNLDSEKGYLFFQKFLKEQGILKELEEMGIEDGDTVRMYYNEFDYYK